MTATSSAITSQGTTIKKGTGTAWAFITGVDGLDIKVATLDTTPLDATNGYKSFISGFKEVSDIAISGYFDYVTQAGILTDLQAGTSASYTIQFPPATGGTTGASWTFTAIVTGFKTKAAVDSVITFDATLKVSGAPTLVSGT